MHKPLTIALTLSLCALGLATTASAGGAKAKRGMSIHNTICPASAPSLRAWARSTSGYGSFAAPYVAGNKGGSCDSYIGYFPTSQSYGHKDSWVADQAALSHCEARKPAGFTGCTIVARSYPIK
ncbi:hypothetical protein [Planktotalea sp.]|uniref:hypothetical protein n=1 Tax=Planktotalea sp. TaxID=2029877 RepID=UPI003D6C51F7